jgi:hypothetical protein
MPEMATNRPPIYNYLYPKGVYDRTLIFHNHLLAPHIASGEATNGARLFFSSQIDKGVGIS